MSSHMLHLIVPDFLPSSPFFLSKDLGSDIMYRN